MMNPGQGRDTRGRFVKAQLNRKAIAPAAACRLRNPIPLLFEQRRGPAKMKCGNTAMRRRWIDRRRIWDGVNGSNEEQQAKQPYGPFRFQIVLDGAKASPCSAFRARVNTILTFWEGSYAT